MGRPQGEGEAQDRLHPWIRFLQARRPSSIQGTAASCVWFFIHFSIFLEGGKLFVDTAGGGFFFQELVEELGVYLLSFDRAGYGESDPNPNRTEKSTALDVEELADQLGLGPKFHVIGFSMGGQATWGCLKYIPHRYGSSEDLFLPSSLKLPWIQT